MTPPAAQQAIRFSQRMALQKPAAAYDPWLLAVTMALLALGLVMVSSSSVAIAAHQLDNPLYYFNRQALYLCGGLVVLWTALQVPLQAWQHTSVLLLVFSVLLLVLVLIPGIGREVNGSMRWISLGMANLQPSELIKVFLPVYLAGYLVRRMDEVRESFSGFVKPIVVLLIIALLLLLEPDYGATAVLFSIVLGMLFMGGVHLGRFMLWLATGIAVMAGVVVLARYRIDRLTSFMDPWADPYDKGFQLTQALIAVGRGEWFGVGLGNSVQKLFYLPEAHTDFLFAVLGEELGFVGMTLVILMFLFVLWRSFQIGRRAEQAGMQYGGFLAYGLGLGIGLQAFVNIGVNLGLLPTKGLTLPLMSYGGSSMLASCLAMGILLRIDHEVRMGEGKW